MEHAFAKPGFSLGIEEELMIVDGRSFGLVNAIEALLEEAVEGDVKPELLASVLEIATPPCRDT
ncbi:MAG: carboxylate-amine ligase, partial [Solirubrobacterales bacterium]|nr:carboxylate-amine ligase [Solirubrobacterales bacterium]